MGPVFRDALDRVTRDPWSPNSSLARGATRHATIRPVRAVAAPVVYPVTPGSGRTATWTPVPVNPYDHEDHPDESTRDYLAALQREDRRWRAAHPVTRSAAGHRRERGLPWV